MFVLRLIIAVLIRLFLKLYCRLKFSGIENLPLGKTFILAANHSSHLDTLCLLAALPWKLINKAFAVSAKDYFKSPLRYFFSSIFCNLLLLDRIHNACASLKQCCSLLGGKNNVLILFPEGARSVNGAVGAFKPGIGFLVAGTSCAVIPTYINGSHAVLSKGSWFPKYKKVSVTFGSPLNFSEFSRNKKGYIEATKQIQQAVERMNR